MPKRAQWGSRLAFILVAAGSAIGLGNIWKFPYVTGQNGGGAFVLVYLACVAVVGLPIMIAELYIGQQSQKNTIDAFEALDKKGTPWRVVGFIGLISAFLIFSFYSVVGGWVFDFVFKAATNQFSSNSETEIKGMLGALFSAPGTQIFWHGMFTLVTGTVVIGGIQNGIEKANKILMPALLGILGFMLIHSMFSSGFGQAMSFLFSPDFSKLSGEAILEAAGQAFFSLSLGMGTMITYGSYLSKEEKLPRTAISVAFMDTMMAIVAGIVIFSIVFSHGLEPAAGPSLMFRTMPVLFSKMPGGMGLAIAFFLLVAFAALTSSVSLIEVVITYFEEKSGLSRKKVTVASCSLTFLVGILSALSTNILSDFKILGYTFFDLFDKLTSNIFLPLGGLIISLFFGWKLGRPAIDAILGDAPAPMKSGLLWITRVLAPITVGIILIKGWPFSF
ncbi:MAG: sodium-dependent transporter [Bdellovibrionaceae bacterium]|nr:sodium-dependent transporter [Pseudobdellovibrionaceae bacterium]|tara:strand:- start:7484 stop:8824 length:1341 start_codon:yes stop_codon:yes gene_type:complete